MTKVLLTILSLWISFQHGFSQNTETKQINKNTIYVEIFGNAGYLYNITYDRIIYTKDKNNISFGIGGQYFNSSDIEDYICSLSQQINYFYGTEHHFETGVGVTYDFNSGDLVIPIRIGYRFQRREGGFFFRIGLTPLFTKSYPIFGEGYALIPWGGLAIGWTF